MRVSNYSFIHLKNYVYFVWYEYTKKIKNNKTWIFSMMYLHKKFQVLVLLLPQKYVAVQYYFSKL